MLATCPDANRTGSVATDPLPPACRRARRLRGTVQWTSEQLLAPTTIITRKPTVIAALAQPRAHIARADDCCDAQRGETHQRAYHGRGHVAAYCARRRRPNPRRRYDERPGLHYSARTSDQIRHTSTLQAITPLGVRRSLLFGVGLPLGAASHRAQTSSDAPTLNPELARPETVYGALSTAAARNPSARTGDYESDGLCHTGFRLRGFVSRPDLTLCQCCLTPVGPKTGPRRRRLTGLSH